MTIVITQEGTIPEPEKPKKIYYLASCKDCNTQFAFEDHDIMEEERPWYLMLFTKPFKEIKCPLCCTRWVIDSEIFPLQIDSTIAPTLCEKIEKLTREKESKRL